MDTKKILMSKNGLAAVALAKEFLKYSIGDKIPTVTEFCEDLKLSRGTVQNSLKLLIDNAVVQIESKGHMGSYLVKKNMTLLLSFADITSIVGVMPLPYSKKYEGLASGLIIAMENIYNIPTSMAYMRGAENRISMLLSNRYDYAIISKYAAQKYQEKYDNIIIIKDFGEYSYVSEHIVLFHDKAHKKIVSGMKVGVDGTSIDHKNLTAQLCSGIKVDFIQVEYSQILQRIQEGQIDAAIWNKDGLSAKDKQIGYTELTLPNVDNTKAVMVVSSGKKEIATLLKEIVDVDTVLNIQRLIIEEKITPSY